VCYMSSLLTFHAESKDTGGSFEFGEWLGKSGNEPPPYVHEREHEFYPDASPKALLTALMRSHFVDKMR
jgi:hypothetical protein